jgi:hypothetical protein
VCPFVNKADRRCAAHWTLRNLSQAFTHCADRYAVCPVYRMLIQELFNDAQGHKEADAAIRVLAAS